MKKSIIAIMMALVLSLGCLTGCGQSATVDNGAQLASGGVLVLSVNPEIAVEYDDNGLVTGVSARNDDALEIISSCKGLIGQETRDVVTKLVTAIGEAGYFVEEVEGERRQITIEIEAGSKLPHDAFLDEVVSDVRDCVNTNKWNVPMDVENESNYGITDYVDTDYGPGNDGYTDYDGTDYANNTDYGVNADGNTDYNDSDYGVWGDGLTDYDHNDDNSTDYGEGNDGVTDYDGTDYANNTDYGINADGDTDYNDTDYGPNNDGVTDYTDYGTTNGSTGNTNYGDSGYQAPAATNPPASSGNSNYGDSNYDDGNSNYSNSNYGSNYGDSGYDD